MQKKYIALFALLIVNIFFGLNYSFEKGLMPVYFSPTALILCRTSIPTLLFFLVAFLMKVKDKIDRKDWKLLILCSIFSIGINQFTFLGGLNLTTPINASIITTSAPVLVLIIAAIFIKEKITKNKVFGIIVGLSGALLLLMFKKKFSFGTKTLPGDLLIFTNAIFYSAYLVIVKPLMQKYHPITVVKWIFLFAFVTTLPFCFNQFLKIQWLSFSTGAWLEFTIVIICGTFFTYFLTILSLKYVSASSAAIFIYIQPLIAAVASILMQQETLTFVKIISAIFIFSGVYLVTMQPKISKSQ